jgi:Putative auto-transporter adhesin, head GIN domain
MAGQEHIEIRETFAARRLQVAEIPGTVQVRGGERATIQVQIAGPKERVERIGREVHGDVLHITGPRPREGGDMTVISRSGGRVQANVFASQISVASVAVGGEDNVAIAGGRIVGGGSDVEPDGEVAVVVDVPLRTPIAIDAGLFGTYEVGDIEGPLQVRMRGGGNVTAGGMGTTRVSIQGAGGVEISGVNGSVLEVAIQGAGEVTVRDGQVDHLDVTVQGAGDAVYDGRARHANLSVMGAGDIRVNQVTESLNDRSMGSGRIRVQVPPRRDPDTFWS